MPTVPLISFPPFFNGKPLPRSSLESHAYALLSRSLEVRFLFMMHPNFFANLRNSRLFPIIS